MTKQRIDKLGGHALLQQVAAHRMAMPVWRQGQQIFELPHHRIWGDDFSAFQVAILGLDRPEQERSSSTQCLLRSRN
ncbi:hypothetical protein D3C72_1805930 [compost metagenome]